MITSKVEISELIIQFVLELDILSQLVIMLGYCGNERPQISL